MSLSAVAIVGLVGIVLSGWVNWLCERFELY